MKFILHDVNFCCHPLAKGPEAWCDKLELDFEKLLLDDGGDKDLNLEVKHVLFGDWFADFKEVFLSTTIVVVYQEAAWVPIIFSIIKHFELDECGLTSLYSSVIFVFQDTFLFGHMFNLSQIFDRSSFFCCKHSWEPCAPVILFGDFS